MSPIWTSKAQRRPPSAVGFARDEDALPELDPDDHGYTSWCERSNVGLACQPAHESVSVLDVCSFS